MTKIQSKKKKKNTNMNLSSFLKVTIPISQRVLRCCSFQMFASACCCRFTCDGSFTGRLVRFLAIFFSYKRCVLICIRLMLFCLCHCFKVILVLQNTELLSCILMLNELKSLMACYECKPAAVFNYYNFWIRAWLKRGQGNENRTTLCVF